jgi:hypothetical protein
MDEFQPVRAGGVLVPVQVEAFDHLLSAGVGGDVFEDLVGGLVSGRGS